ncbi:hypothetical protein LTS18_001780, partial [Coniosporium uncinatum]
LKDCDVTWLYGPLHTPNPTSFDAVASEPQSNLSKNNSFINKKPILKKRSMSEVLLQKSIHSGSLLKQASAAVLEQQTVRSVLKRPAAIRIQSDFAPSTLPSRTISRDTTDYFSSRSTSGLQTPDGQCEKRHIRFHDTVEQCIAVDVKEHDDDEDDWTARKNDNNDNDDDDDSSDDGVIMMAKTKKKPLSRTNSRASFSSDNKTIAKLPDAPLKYRTDSPDITEE